MWSAAFSSVSSAAVSSAEPIGSCTTAIGPPSEHGSKPMAQAANGYKSLTACCDQTFENVLLPAGQSKEPEMSHRISGEYQTCISMWSPALSSVSSAAVGSAGPVGSCTTATTPPYSAWQAHGTSCKLLQVTEPAVTRPSKSYCCLQPSSKNQTCHTASAVDLIPV
jgi:hypothetical protein